jgi:hypothetical protein
MHTPGRAVSGTLLHNRSLAGYTVDMRESEYPEATGTIHEGKASCLYSRCRADISRLGRDLLRLVEQ